MSDKGRKADCQDLCWTVNRICLWLDGLLSNKSRYNEINSNAGLTAIRRKDISMGNDNKILATVITVMLILSALAGIVAAIKDEFEK